MRIVSKRKTVLKKFIACSVFEIAGIFVIWLGMTYESEKYS
ncbi:hypothetical protein [Pallidibacillus pasinlerensis]|nr:hypothetical protein [Pallidibacillus pasinlerensis]